MATRPGFPTTSRPAARWTVLSRKDVDSGSRPPTTSDPLAPPNARFPAGVFISGCQAARAPKDMQQTQPQRNPCPGAAVRMADGLGQPATRYQKDKECSDDILRLIAAILLPPLGVFLQVGFGGAFWLNILLTLFGYIPGIIHAVWIIARR